MIERKEEKKRLNFFVSHILPDIIFFSVNAIDVRIHKLIYKCLSTKVGLEESGQNILFNTEGRKTLT